MANFILNIGLDGCAIRDSSPMLRTIIRSILGGEAFAGMVRVPATQDREETLIVSLHADVLPSRLYSLARTLDQEAIAYYDEGNDYGLLIGPEAHKWPRFDKSKFVTADNMED